MDLPVRVAFPKLSRTHLLELLTPFIPGIVIVTGLALTNSSLALQFAALALGYRSKLVVAVAIAYISGLTIMAVADGLVTFLFGKIAPLHNADASSNTYWRRVAAKYVGADLSPAAITWSPEDMTTATKFLESLSVLRGSSSKPLVPLLESLHATIRASNEAASKEGTSSTPADSARVQAIEEAQRVAESIDRDLRNLGSAVEWNSLRQALDFMPSDVERPYTSFSLVMNALQAAGLSAIWLLLAYRELFSLSGLSLAVALVAVTTWAIWLRRRLYRYYSSFGANQIAFMLHEMEKRRTRVPT